MAANTSVCAGIKYFTRNRVSNISYRQQLKDEKHYILQSNTVFNVLLNIMSLCFFGNWDKVLFDHK